MAKQKVKKEEPITSSVSNEDILFAHMVLQSTGATPEYRERANSIYKELFGEDVIYSCCKNRAYIKLDYYIRNTLKLL